MSDGNESGAPNPWAQPGSGDATPPLPGSGDSAPYRAYPGTPTWPTLPDQQLVERQPTYGPPPAGPPGPRRSRTTPIAIVVALLVAVLVLLVGGVVAILGGTGALSALDEGEFADELPFAPPTSIDVEAPPDVIAPPADGDAAVAAIRELEQFIFTPNPDPAAWESRFTDPTGLREKIEPYASTQCAVGVRTVVVAVRFLDENHAEVDYVFVGPNVPDIGSTFVFTGEVERVEGGAWLATPSGVEQVAALATGYCMREEPAPREGLEDGVDGTGTHDQGDPATPLQR